MISRTLDIVCAGALTLLFGSSALSGCVLAETEQEASPSVSIDAPATAEDTATTEPDSKIGAGGDEGAGPETGAHAEPTSNTASAVLQTLLVKGRAPKTGYARAEFGKGWKDPDRNGCDARNDVLARDLIDVHRDGSCKVTSGTLDDPYTGTSIAFVRGAQSSQAVQIDHVVALSDAWQKGAQQLSVDERVGLANDPLNLLAVDGSANNSKGDGDAATWLPPNTGYRCQYVARQIAVKATYRLWVTQAEKEAMKRVLADCPAQTVPAA